jgi:hypothetical protein
MVDKVAQATVFFCALKKGNAPAVLVLVGDAPAHGKATETKSHIGGVVAVQAEKLAHGFCFISVAILTSSSRGFAPKACLRVMHPSFARLRSFQSSKSTA